MQFIQSDQEWSEYLAVRNAFAWNNPQTVEQVKALHAAIQVSAKSEVTLVREEGRAIACAGYRHITQTTEVDSYSLIAFANPNSATAREDFARGIDTAIELAEGLGGKILRYEGRAEYPWLVEVMESRGFRNASRAPVSCLDLEQNQYQRPQPPAGHEIISYKEYAERKPDSWKRDAWLLEMELCKDLPLTFEFVPTPFEEFEPFLEDPTWDKSLAFFCLVDGELAGLSQLYDTADPRYGGTGLTGVLRKFRRQGIARRMKEHGAAVARERGMKLVFTDNEENNPMYQLNLQLGYKHLFDYITYMRP